MRKRIFVLFAVLLIGFAVRVTVMAGAVMLHPAGFGEHSRRRRHLLKGSLTKIEVLLV